MSADYEVTITVKTNVPVMAEDMTGLDAINVAMDYGLSRMLKDGEYKLVGVTVERVAIQDTDDDVEDEYQEDDRQQDEDEIPEPDEADDEPEDDTENNEPEDTDGDSDYQDADDDPEPETTEVQFTEPDKGDIVIAKRTPPSSLPLPKIGG